MATVWSPAPYIEKEEWLLADGSIVTSPDFESTSSGRRVRIAGTTVSAGSKQIHELVSAAIEKVAADKGTQKLLRIYPLDQEQMYRASVVSLDSTIFKKSVSIGDLEPHGYSEHVLFWDFEAVDLPIYASVFVLLKQHGAAFSVATRVAWRSTLSTESGCAYCHHDGSNLYLSSLYRHSQEFRDFETAINSRGGLIPGIALDQKPHSSQFRRAIVDFATRGKSIDELEEIHLPDLRDPSKQAFLKFKRKASNYSGSTHNELLTLVQTGPLIDKIKNSYTDLVSAMKSLGVVVTTEIGDTEFAKAAAGDLAQLRVTLAANEDADIPNPSFRGQAGVDPAHTVTLDLSTGTVVVSCSHKTGLEEVAEAWNIAKFKAEVVGETDVLLEYAQAYKFPKEQARLRKIIEQRSTPDTL
jgi:hypothetical protein